jgi:hypothetical protein
MKTHNRLIYHCLCCGRVVHQERDEVRPQCCGRGMVKAAAETVREPNGNGGKKRSNSEVGRRIPNRSTR